MSPDIKETFRNHLLKTYQDNELKRWFDPIKLTLSESDGLISVHFPHAFFADWFAQSNRAGFEEELARFMGDGFAIRYNHNNGATGPKGPAAGGSPVTNINFPFGHQFTFENFLVNKKNYFPLASAREVSKQKDIVFNPFVICGQNGSGKTHLLKAIANEISKRFDQARIFLGSIEDLGDVFDSRFANDPWAAREFVHNHDFLIIDDFQRIRKMARLQQELIIVFNHFYDHKKQMVFSCSDKLSSYDFLDPTLKSRLEWGLIVNLKQPDLDIRISFIQEQCRLKRLSLTKEQILILGQRFQDFRYLQGILTKLFAFKELLKQDIGAKEFERILNNTEDKSPASLSPEIIMTVTARRFNLEVADITGNRRKQEIAQARQIAMYLCRNLIGSSYPALGRVFGGKDHSTVLYSVNKIKEIQKDDLDMKRLLNDLKEACLLEREE